MTDEKRSVRRCIKCGKDRPIAAFSQCYRCYRRNKRADAKPVDAANKNAARLIQQFSTIMKTLANVGMSDDDLKIIRSLLAPYFASLSGYLNIFPPEEQDDPPETMD